MATKGKKMTNATSYMFTFYCCILLRHLPVVLAYSHAYFGGVLVKYVTNQISKWLSSYQSIPQYSGKTMQRYLHAYLYCKNRISQIQHVNATYTPNKHP